MLPGEEVTFDPNTAPLPKGADENTTCVSYCASVFILAAVCIDPTFMPSPAAYALYGWAITRHYSADAGVAVTFEPLPDLRDEAPSPTQRETSPHEDHAAARRIFARDAAAGLSRAYCICVHVVHVCMHF